MNIRQVIAGTIALCAFASPALAEVCMVGPAKQTLDHWLLQSGQTPLIQMHIAIGPNEFWPAMIAVAANGEFSILFLNKENQTCLMAVGKGAMPAKASLLPAEPVKPEKSL